MMANIIDMEDNIIKNQSKVLKRTTDVPKEEIKQSNEDPVKEILLCVCQKDSYTQIEHTHYALRS